MCTAAQSCARVFAHPHVCITTGTCVYSSMRFCTRICTATRTHRRVCAAAWGCARVFAPLHVCSDTGGRVPTAARSSAHAFAPLHACTDTLMRVRSGMGPCTRICTATRETHVHLHRRRDACAPRRAAVHPYTHTPTQGCVCDTRVHTTTQLTHAPTRGTRLRAHPCPRTRVCAAARARQPRMQRHAAECMRPHACARARVGSCPPAAARAPFHARPRSAHTRVRRPRGCPRRPGGIRRGSTLLCKQAPGGIKRALGGGGDTGDGDMVGGGHTHTRRGGGCGTPREWGSGGVGGGGVPAASGGG